LSCDPKLLIADEPTTALDVTIQAQILEIVRRLRAELGMAIVWITHDLGVIAGIADRIMVMYAGLVVEEAAAGDLFADPRHPYTKSLLDTLPNLKGKRSGRLRAISGQPPHLLGAPKGCPFAPRCIWVHDRCLRETPPLLEAAPGGHRAACWLVTSVDSRQAA
jgi:oligopeptide/dipeptide ABC transporter ATP-binding protein